MPLTKRRIEPGRVQFRESLTADELNVLASDTNIRVLQTDEPVQPSFWPELNESFFLGRPDVESRVFARSRRLARLDQPSQESAPTSSIRPAWLRSRLLIH